MLPGRTASSKHNAVSLAELETRVSGLMEVTRNEFTSAYSCRQLLREMMEENMEKLGKIRVIWKQ